MNMADSIRLCTDVVPEVETPGVVDAEALEGLPGALQTCLPPLAKGFA